MLLCPSSSSYKTRSNEWHPNIISNLTIKFITLAKQVLPLMLLYQVLCCRNTLRERLRTHKVFTKDQCFYFNYHTFSIKSYVLDVY